MNSRMCRYPDCVTGVSNGNLGITMDGARTSASGHPDLRISAKSGRGPVSRLDEGKTLTMISLKARADFHDLEIGRTSPGESTAHGFASEYHSVQVSRDGGSTWTSGATMELRDTTPTPEASSLQLSFSAGTPGQPMLVGIVASPVVTS